MAAAAILDLMFVKYGCMQDVKLCPHINFHANAWNSN